MPGLGWTRHLGGSMRLRVIRASVTAVAAALSFALSAAPATADPAGIVKHINPAGTSNGAPRDFTSIGGGTTIFAAYDSADGWEIWRTDGTAGGTALVKDIYPGLQGSLPQHLVAIGSTVFFAAGDGIHGTELWKTDGTPGGTGMVKDIDPGAASASPDWLVNSAGTRLLSAYDCTEGTQL